MAGARKEFRQAGYSNTATHILDAPRVDIGLTTYVMAESPQAIRISMNEHVYA